VCHIEARRKEEETQIIDEESNGNHFRQFPLQAPCSSTLAEGKSLSGNGDGSETAQSKQSLEDEETTSIEEKSRESNEMLPLDL